MGHHLYYTIDQPTSPTQLKRAKPSYSVFSSIVPIATGKDSPRIMKAKAPEIADRFIVTLSSTGGSGTQGSYYRTATGCISKESSRCRSVFITMSGSQVDDASNDRMIFVRLPRQLLEANVHHSV